MHHCPYCGTKVKIDELYCIKCGNQLPADMQIRLENKRTFNKYWYVPLFLVILFAFIIGIYYILLQNNVTAAKELYLKAEKNAIESNYKEASNLLSSALNKKDNFSQAKIAQKYVQKAITIDDSIKKASMLSKQQKYQDAIAVINESENIVQNYEGEAVTKLIAELNNKRESIKLDHLKQKLDTDPGIDELKLLLWEAEAIKTEEAKKITASIRDQIINYISAKATEKLNNKQFSKALIIVEDGLKYAPNSTKLKSLKTTIDKEKTAFETAQQQRIARAVNTAEQERKRNKHSAIKLSSVNIKQDDQGNLKVAGKVKSTATIPVNSILIAYTLKTEKGKTLVKNEVYVFPDKLFPDDTGKFEFTHYDIDQRDKDVSVKIEKIKWYTE